ncbi:MAG TPA: ribokinase [Acidimicrobiales bacterium]|nr:ribokinase [Acidimicrobiales bacterium]
MPSPVVAVVGSLNRDLMLRTPRRPGPGETVTGATLAVTGGGKGANQAWAVASLGVAVHLVGRIGDDDAGAELLAGLRHPLLATDGVLVTPGVASGTAVIAVTPDGENSIIVADGANELLAPADLDGAAPVLSTAAVLLVQLEISLATVGRAAELAGPETLVVLSAAPFRPLPPELLRRVDVLVANEPEATALAGTAAGGRAALFGRLRALGTGVVVVTLGADGAAVVTAEGVLAVPGRPARVLDTTGAGDAFAGALAAWLAAAGTARSALGNGTVLDAVRAGIAAATFAVGRPGARASYGTRAEIGAPWE